MRSRAIMRRLYDYFVEHWIISALVSATPAFMFGFTRLFAKRLEDTSGTLHPTAFWTIVPILAVSLFFTVAKALAVNFDTKAKANGQSVLESMLDFANGLTDRKSTRFLEYISQNHNKEKSSLDPFTIITQPRRQIAEICKCLRMCIRDIFDIKLEDIGVSVVYRPSPESRWVWLHREGVENDLSLRQVIDSPTSTFNLVLTRDAARVFYPNKRDAIQKG